MITNRVVNHNRSHNLVPGKPITCSLVSHVVKTHAANGNIKLSHTTMGEAMRCALLTKGVQNVS